MAICDRIEPKAPGSGEQVTLRRNGPVRVALLAALLATASCSAVERMSDSKLTLDTPIGWWHDLQGGKIAEVRPPPPGVTDPYPNLSLVPPLPTPTDAPTRRALAARLMAERDRTQREATQDPLVLPVAANAVPPRAPSITAARPAAPPPDPGASVAVLDGATAPAPPAPPPATAPPASTAPIAAPAAGTPPVGVASGEPQERKPAIESGPTPDLPTEAPPLPRLRGIPGTVSAPAVPRLPPGVAIAFRPGSAALPASADAALRELAGRRAGAVIAVAAGGDAAGPGAAAQARALPLALRRTQGMQDVLVAAGVPAASIRINAAALGRGGDARLLQ